MAPDKSETSYPSPINEPIAQEESMDTTGSDKPDLTNIPKEVLFQDCLLPPWIWTHSDDAS